MTAGVLLAGAAPAQAEPPCGYPPVVADESLKAEIEGEAKSRSQAVLGANESGLSGQIQAARTDIFSKYPNAEQARTEAYLAYIFCTSVLNNPQSSPEQRLQFLVVYRGSGPANAAQEQFLARYDQLQRETGLKDMALAAFFRDIGHEPVALDQLYPTLLEYAAKYAALQRRVDAIPETDSVTAGVKRQARSALDSGDYEAGAAFAAISNNMIRSLQSLQENKPDQAIVALAEAEKQLNGLRTPSSPRSELLRGYIYKTRAQAASMKGETAQVDEYAGLAAKSFNSVRDRRGGITTDEIAGAINGLGNIEHQRGKFREAIADYQAATSLQPRYAYAWHDMFISYYELAQRGEVDLSAMRHALDKLKETAPGMPLLDAKYIARLEKLYAEVSRPARPDRRRTR